ncbi:MAG: alpha/beta hydrolase [Thermoflexales bacterium]|nr:alpha/beta hydrolase [Thermoflexales bacterium]
MSSSWTIRNLLNPVISRLLIYGLHPIDVETVLAAVESKPLLNAKSLERSWLAEWEGRASHYAGLAERAEQAGHLVSAGKLFAMAAQCYYAAFLINPSGEGEKKRVYLRYAEFYRRSECCYPSPVTPVEIPLENGVLPGYLHLPTPAQPPPVRVCAVIMAGLGSCKEEMAMLARPLVARGAAAFVPDMPGSGEALFVHDVKCRFHNLEAAFPRILDTLSARPELQQTVFGSYGLCMGGGYAHRAACADRRYAFCVTLFMLYITHTAADSTPQWMRQGGWYDFQTGGLPAEQFRQEMQALAEGDLACPYFFIHGRHDNWMSLDSATAFYDRAQGPKEKLIIENTPVFSNQQAVTHTMPVGEQLHWVKHVAADWITTHAHR